jgi:hypothetical protein
MTPRTLTGALVSFLALLAHASPATAQGQRATL